MEDEFLTVTEGAELLKLNQQAIRNWIDARQLPAIRVGRRVRVRRSQLEEFISAGEMPGPEEPDEQHRVSQADAPESGSGKEEMGMHDEFMSAVNAISRISADQPSSDVAPALRRLAEAAEALADAIDNRSK